jgi:hypothetical protein
MVAPLSATGAGGAGEAWEGCAIGKGFSLNGVLSDGGLGESSALVAVLPCCAEPRTTARLPLGGTRCSACQVTVRASGRYFYRRALAVSLQTLRHTGARDEAIRLIRRNILQQVLVEALG